MGTPSEAELQRARAAGALVAHDAARRAVRADQSSEPGGLLRQVVANILRDGDVTVDDITGEKLTGFCAELERLVAGWGTGRDPLVNRVPNDADDLPLGPFM